MFHDLDLDGSQQLEREELSELMKRLLRRPPTEDETSKVLHELDLDDSGTVSCEELTKLYETEGSSA